MRNPICLLVGLVRSIRCRAIVTGHAYETVPDTPENIHILKCRRCGYESVAWSFDSLEGQK